MKRGDNIDNSNAVWEAHVLFLLIGLLLPTLQAWSNANLYKEYFEELDNRINIYSKTILYYLLQIIIVLIVIKQFHSPFSIISSDLSIGLKIVCGLIIFGWIWSLTPKEADNHTIFSTIRIISKRLPSDRKEKILFIGACISNGMSQELVYRGFLIFYLTKVFPMLPFYFALIISSIIFSLRKLYFGWKNVMWNLYFGLVMSFFYLATGNIISSIVVSIFLMLAFWRPEYWMR